jgi:crotonobetainyl-CoA:carnitine CoA-transferase CaiB-like acyl-CoA transferase
MASSNDVTTTSPAVDRENDQGARSFRDGPALEGIRVIDFGQFLAGPLLTMMLSDLGAEVIRVDPPGGPRWDHDVNAMLQRGKRSIVLDLKDAADLETARRLVESADVVVEGFRPHVLNRLGLGHKESITSNPRLIYVSLPGFAHDDPRAEIPAWEGVLNAAVGVYEVLPGFDRPTFNALPVASSYGAMVAAHSVMAALIARERDGRGQWVEVPLFDSAFEAIGQRGQYIATAESIPYRPTRQMPPPLGHYRCADDRWLHLCLIQDRHLQWFGEHFMPKEWIDDGMTNGDRLWNDAELMVRARARFSELFRTRTALEWECAINETSGAPSALCATSEQWLRDDSHARAIGAVVDVDDPVLGRVAQAGHPVQLSETPPRVQFARRRLDEDREHIAAGLPAHHQAPPPDSSPRLSQALAGVRVVDLTQVLAGPTSTRVLAEYGADVIKVQSAADNQMRYHFYGNSGKRAIILDLKHDDGREVLYRMAEDVDVFVENYAKGVAERLGVGEDEIRRRSPAVVYASISAYGRSGYRGGWRGREELGQAITGMQVRWGGYGYDDEPLQGPMTFTDSGSGLFGAFAILVGLFHRARTGVGQRVESSLAHAATFEQIPFMVAYEGRQWQEPNGLDAIGWQPLDRLYQASDGWLYLAAIGVGDREKLTAITGFEDLDFDSEKTLEEQLVDRFQRDTARSWAERLQQKGIAAHNVLSVEEVMEDELSKSRGLSTLREHEGIGVIRNPGPSSRLSATPARLTSPAPRPGLQSRAVLNGLGLSHRADDLIARGVVRESLPDSVELFGRPR